MAADDTLEADVRNLELMTERVHHRLISEAEDRTDRVELTHRLFHTADDLTNTLGVWREG